jgi:hypothetical protein
MNFTNDLMGAVAPNVTGFIVGAPQSFANALAAAGALVLIGIFSYVIVLGKIEPIPRQRRPAERPTRRPVKFW